MNKFSKIFSLLLVSLLKGLKNCTTFRCVYLIDRCPSQSNYSINKWRFLIQSLQDLNKNFQKLGSKLLVIRGQPAEVFPPLFKGNQLIDTP